MAVPGTIDAGLLSALSSKSPVVTARQAVTAESWTAAREISALYRPSSLHSWFTLLLGLFYHWGGTAQKLCPSPGADAFNKQLESTCTSTLLTLK